MVSNEFISSYNSWKKRKKKKIWKAKYQKETILSLVKTAKRVRSQFP